ncbi:MAG: dependent oxidoreductase [Myxococcales bacterium]|nr:dependent oxidoreductase [Myxococcales bacterium]
MAGVCYKAWVHELPSSTDVAIVGGGFAGAATAWALARKGVRDVVVLEREVELGRFASGRGAGLGRQITEDDDTTALTVRGASLLRELPGVWTQTGGLLGFDHEARAQDALARARRFGVAAEIIERDAVIDRWPELGALPIVHALWVPSDGAIDVAASLRALTASARIVLGAGVERLERGRVVTSRGAITAKVIVDATGAWAGTLVGDPALEAFKRHVYVIDAETAPETPWLWNLGDRELYVRRAPGGVLVSPCDATIVPAGAQEPDPSGDAKLHELLGNTGFSEAAIVRRWACQRTFTADRKMRLGRDPARPWLVWAVGLGGHGATAAPAVGERVADAVIEALA